jgi:YafQ family addiction module toxin component
MYTISLKKDFERQLRKVKDTQSQKNIKNKIVEIAKTVETNPNHYKNLKKPMQKYKRAHVNNSYVLIFRVDEKNKEVIFFDYSHHDSIYNKN